MGATPALQRPVFCPEVARTTLRWHLCPGPCSLLLISPSPLIPASKSFLQKCPLASSPSSPSTEVPVTQPPSALGCHRDHLCIAGKGICINSYCINGKASMVFLPLSRATVPQGRHRHSLVGGATVSAQAQLLTKLWLDNMGLSQTSAREAENSLLERS